MCDLLQLHCVHSRLILRFKQGWVLLIPEKHLLMRLVAALITSMVFTCVLLVIR